MTSINVVWLKRDLRLQDHEPFWLAEKEKLPYRIIYIFDTAMLAHPATALRHLQFVYHSLNALNKQLEPFKRSVELFYGKTDEVFTYLFENHSVQKVFSHKESGVELSWQIDKKVARLCEKHKVNWKECNCNGVLRGIQNRDGWDKHWYVTMHAQQFINSYSKTIYLRCSIILNFLKHLNNN